MMNWKKIRIVQAMAACKQASRTKPQWLPAATATPCWKAAQNVIHEEDDAFGSGNTSRSSSRSGCGGDQSAPATSQGSLGAVWRRPQQHVDCPFAVSATPAKAAGRRHDHPNGAVRNHLLHPGNSVDGGRQHHEQVGRRWRWAPNGGMEIGSPHAGGKTHAWRSAPVCRPQPLPRIPATSAATTSAVVLIARHHGQRAGKSKFSPTPLAWYHRLP
jgi:hypothetical protein